MRLFIAEKPELARAIAEALEGTTKREKSYIQKGDNIITWAFGHLLELYKPEDYDKNLKQWKLEDLPFFVKEFKHKPLKDDFKQEQLKNIVKLINDTRVKEIIHCGDADDEGQILIDEILQYAKNTKPVKRALINDITEEAIKAELANLKPNSNFKKMSEKGFARSFADFLVGINLTRAYTCKNGGELLTIGRVQTPILGLIVNRDLEFENFKSFDYYTLEASLEINNLNIKATLQSENEITEKDFIEAIKKQCENKITSLSIKKEAEKEYPPLPYNLLVLQTEASKLYGYSPSKTLEITQKLREEYKAITYNRSDCQYLPNTIYNQRQDLLSTIKANFKEDIGQDNVNLSVKSKAFDDSKLTAHYAIIPTQSKFDINKLSEEQRNIYTLITQRFLMQFYEAREFNSYALEFKINHHNFKTTITKTTKLGFKAYFSNTKEEKEEETNLSEELIAFLDSTSNANARVAELEIKTQKKKPRPKYTMTTLLKDLNQVSKYVKNPEIKKLLLEKDKDKKGESGGIGTPATRSAMIDRLISVGYIEVSKDKSQKINSTKKGREFISILNPLLREPDMTALWFEYQKEIENGIRTIENFLNYVQNNIEIEIKAIKESDFKLSSTKTTQAKNAITCPQCKNGFLVRRESKNKKGTFFYGCSEFKNGCKFICYERNGKPLLQNTNLKK